MKNRAYEEALILVQQKAMPMTADIATLRRNYSRQSLNKTDVLPSPVDQFARWFEEALQSQLPEPNAMTLATADLSARPAVRTVLLKGFDAEGFVFYTNYESSKGNDLAENPQAALLFTWLELERQIRIEGLVEKISREESLEYFQSRPLESQIGAWASPQSRVIADRSVLEARSVELQAEYAGAAVLPLPPFWGGYRLRPDCFEFWQGRESRLHDRICYTQEDGRWNIQRLAP